MPRSERKALKGVEAAIEPERELVEVGLQVLGADAVMVIAHPLLILRDRCGELTSGWKEVARGRRI